MPPISSLGQKRMSWVFWTSPLWKVKASKGFEDLSYSWGISCEQKIWQSHLASYVIISRSCLKRTFPVCMLHFSKGGKLTTEPDIMLLCRIFDMILNFKYKAYSEKRGWVKRKSFNVLKNRYTCPNIQKLKGIRPEIWGATLLCVLWTFWWQYFGEC